MNALIRLFPAEEQEFWKNILNYEGLNEIRFRAGKALMAVAAGEDFFICRQGELVKNVDEARCITGTEIARLLLHFCRYSPYAYEEELREGFLTLEGGHRLGLSGQAVMENGKIKTIRNVSFMNLRIAHQIKGAADEVLPLVYHEGEIRNTLIVSKPGGGKTTLLRDLIRQVSDGNRYGRGRIVGVVDERSELAGCFQGIPQNDLGIRTDVLDGCKKDIGMELMIRSMSPEILAVDELGRMSGERKTVKEAVRSGVKVFATTHGEIRQEICDPENRRIFDLMIGLERQDGKVRVKTCWEKNGGDETIRVSNDFSGQYGAGKNVCGKDFSGDPTFGAAGRDTGTD